jgi:hypothetical protein
MMVRTLSAAMAVSMSAKPGRAVTGSLPRTALS